MLFIDTKSISFAGCNPAHRKKKKKIRDSVTRLFVFENTDLYTLVMAKPFTLTLFLGTARRVGQELSDAAVASLVCQIDRQLSRF